jgi:mono/diheme cytochrome c family protein
MKRLTFAGIGITWFTALVSCELENHAPPPVTSAMTRTAKKNVDLAALNEGRSLFVRRCIECHTLPAFWHYSDGEWPRILDDMSHRARLDSAQREAILAYLRAIRSARS